MIDKFVVIRWLLSHTAVLRKVSEIVAGWGATLSLSEKLEIVYRIAQAILPVIESFPLFAAQAQSLSKEDEEEQLAQAQSIGISPVILLHVIVPILTGLIRLLMNRNNDE
jgi:hypothetical protein